MATVLDLGLLEGFTAIFTMLFVFAIVYGLLTYMKFFGDNKSIHALIALVFGVLMLFTPKATLVIKKMIPWFVIFIIAGVIILMIYKTFGATDEGIRWTMANYGGLKWGVFIISIIIVVTSISSVYFEEPTGNDVQTSTENTTTLADAYEGDVGSTGEGAFMATIFHPKVLGMLIVLLIAVFAISQLTEGPRR